MLIYCEVCSACASQLKACLNVTVLVVQSSFLPGVEAFEPVRVKLLTIPAEDARRTHPEGLINQVSLHIPNSLSEEELNSCGALLLVWGMSSLHNIKMASATPPVKPL